MINLLRTSVILLFLLITWCSVPVKGVENNRKSKLDAHQISSNSQCPMKSLPKDIEDETIQNDLDGEGIQNTAADTKECEDQVAIDEIVKPQAASKYFNYKQNREWVKFRRLIEEAEKDYKDTKSQRLKCEKGSCDCYSFVIDKDLIPFSNGITAELIRDARPRGVLYQILNGKLYRDKDCKFPARCSGIEHFLLEIVNELPDMELVINVSDYPQIPNFEGLKKSVIPLFSFSKTPKYLDIYYPAWSFWDGGPSISIFPRGLGRWDLLRKSLLKIAKLNSWDEKRNQAFFRGSRTSAERDPLILVSRSFPDLVDAKYTKNQAWKSDADTLHEPAATEVKLEDHCQFKYLFNFRGVSASFRFKHLFLCKSLVFHVGDEWGEFFYAAIKPWIHYIPVNKDSNQEELRSLVEFAQFHDTTAQKIADRGYRFIKSNLRLSQVSCYWRELLIKYSRLLKYKILPRPDLVQI